MLILNVTCASDCLSDLFLSFFTTSTCCPRTNLFCDKQFMGDLNSHLHYSLETGEMLGGLLIDTACMLDFFIAICES